MHTQHRFLELLNKYIANAISPEEHDELLNLISSGQYDDLLHQHFQSNVQKKNVEGVDLPPYRAQKILINILSSEKHTARIIPAVIRNKKMVWLSVAASVLVLVFLATFYLVTDGTSGSEKAYKQHFASNMVEKENLSDFPLRMQLEDSSFVTLQPGSKINYPNHFSAGKREVYMEGQVFFEIKKHPGRPFFVYNNNLITQVLGTSFNIKMDKEKKLVEVSVLSGRVQVYENNTLSNSPNNPKSQAVILTPNQKVIYKEDDKRFIATLISNPLPVSDESSSSQVEPQSFVFEESLLSTVLERLEKSYGIEIVVQNDAINQCLFTGDVTKYDLYEKLTIICESVKASYEINGTRILINGQGCY